MLIETYKDRLLIMLQRPTFWVADDPHGAACVSIHCRENAIAVQRKKIRSCLVFLCLLFWRTLLSRSWQRYRDIVQAGAINEVDSEAWRSRIQCDLQMRQRAAQTIV